MTKLYPRDIYLKKMIDFQDQDLIKVVTGIRRCGKSSLLELMIQHLKETGIGDDQIIQINFESMKFARFTPDDIYEYVKEHICLEKRTYMFFDEVQIVNGWEKAINSFRIDFDCDIYLTGSNAYMLSSDLSTYLSGRYIEIKVYPLSFREFLNFHDYTIADRKTITGEIKKVILDENGNSIDLKEAYNAYVMFGGMPIVSSIGLEMDKASSSLEGIYSTVIIKDVLEREKRKDEKIITDPVLLKKIVMFLADNIGNNTSASSIANTLSNEGILDGNGKRKKVASRTVQVYIEALKQAYVFYEINRFDLKGKDYLRTLGKYYIVDSGLRNYLLGFKGGDRGHILENIIYFELLRRGYDVAIGKIDSLEVDFIAKKVNETKYIQVTESMNDQSTRERELKPLLKIKDNYEKVVLALDFDDFGDYQGIKVMNAIEFLLN